MPGYVAVPGNQLPHFWQSVVVAIVERILSKSLYIKEKIA